MSVFTISIPMGRLDQREQQRIAVGITALYTDQADSADPGIHVLFHAYPKGAAWSSSRPAAPVIVEGCVNTDHPSASSEQLSQAITGLLVEVLGDTTTSIIVRVTGSATDPAAGASTPPVDVQAERPVSTSSGD